jgi:hypothetical protein
VLDLLVVCLALLAAVAALWAFRRTRAYAHLPVAILSVGISTLIGSGIGSFVRASSLAPERYRCGTPLAVASAALFILWSAVGTVGLGLLAHPLTRDTGRRILLFALPASMALALLAGLGAGLWP